MKYTNDHSIDFLDFDPEMSGNECLWKTCAPVSVKEEEGDILFELPFQRQKPAIEIEPDTSCPRRSFVLRIRAYGDSIVRLAIGFDREPMKDSVMLDMDEEVRIHPLRIEKTNEAWRVRDEKGRIRASLNRKPIDTDFWSDLLPEPRESLELTLYPDGNTPVKLSAYDQFFPAIQDAYPLAVVEKNGHFDRSTLSIEVEPDEKFVGSGERFAKMDLSGRTFQLKNQYAQGVNNRRAYKNVPFLMSSRMYGVFLHTSAYGKISVADHSTRSLQFLVEEPEIDLFVTGGSTPESILKSYRQITGFPTMLPTWSFGTWMSRMTYFSEEEVITICERLRKEDYPCDVIHLDTGWFRKDWLCEWRFSEERFPEPERFIKRLQKDGYKVSLWQLPLIGTEAEQYEEARDNKYIGTSTRDKVKVGSEFDTAGYAGTIDFTLPEATDWYKGLLKQLLDMGVVCIKTDFGEEIHMEAIYHEMGPEKLNNLYGLLYQKAAFEVTKEITGDGIVWARAGWAGCQRYPLHWGGDCASSWDGMAGSLKGGLHLGLSGFGFWSHDVPGFHGVPDFMNSVIPDDLYVRWTQFGVFTSHLRYHGTSKREPYEYPAISGIVRKWLKLRYALIPYLLRQSEKTTRTGYPVLRAMIFHHPGNKLCWHLDDQYYFGDDFLVAPVMNSDNIRDIYLPEGVWVNFFSGEVYEGDQWLRNYDCPLEEMPVWVKQGSRIEVYPHPVSHTGEIDPDKYAGIRFDASYEGLSKSVLKEIWGQD